MFSKLTNLYFPICSLTIMILLLCLFYSKRNVENQETKVYSKLIIVGFAEAFLYCIICASAHIIDIETHLYYYYFLNKILCIIYLIWFGLLYKYEINISYLDDKKYVAERFMNILYVIETIIALFVIILPIKIYFDPSTGLSNAYGISTNVLFLGIGLFLFSMFIVVINCFGNKNIKKYMPFYLLLLLMLIG